MHMKKTLLLFAGLFCLTLAAMAQNKGPEWLSEAVIYQIYRLRGDLSVALSQQAKFLEMNQTCIMNNSNFDKKKKDDIIRKQKALASELNKISDKLKVKSNKSVTDAKRDIEKDNKELTIDKIRDSVSNSPFEII